jgi:hypothetical protein
MKNTLFLAWLALCVCLPAFATDPTIADTVYLANGQPSNGGSIDVMPTCGFTSFDGRSISRGNTHIALSSDGTFSTMLVATSNATQTCANAVNVGLYYTATFTLSDGSVYNETWNVYPSSTPLTISMVWTVAYPFAPTIPLGSLASGGASGGNITMCFNVSTGHWGPGNCGGGGAVYPSGSGIPIVTGGTAWGTTLAGGTAGHYIRDNGTAWVSSTIQASDVPTLNQNTTGNAATATNLAGSQSANLFYASPNGTPGAGGYRAIVPADIPTLNQNTTGNAATATLAASATAAASATTAATATALAGTPSQCSGLTPIVAGISANGNANCIAGGLTHVGGNPISAPAYVGVKVRQEDAIGAGTAVWTSVDQYTWMNDNGQLSFVFQPCHYWVDATSTNGTPNGSDSNNGLSPTTPWATITKLNTVTYVNNDSVCMAANSVWQNQSFTPNSVSGLQLYAYGTGAAPDINASQIIPNANWSLAPTCSNTWIATVTLTFGASSGDDWVNFWENSIASQRQSPVSSCLDTASGLAYYPSSDNGPNSHSITVLLHTSDGSSPVSNGRIYEVSSVEYGLNWVGITNAVVANIKAEKSMGIDGVAWFGQNAKLYNFQAWHGNKHNLYWQSGGQCTGCFAYGAYYNSASTLIIVADTNAVSGTVSCTGCTFEMPPYESGWSSLVEGWGLHAVVSGNFGTVNLTNATCIGIGTCAAASDATASNFTNISCTLCNQGIAPGSSSNGNYTGGTTNINGLYQTGGNYAIQPVATGITVNAANVSFGSVNASSALFYCPASLASCTLNLTSSLISYGAPWYGVECVATSCTVALGGSPTTGNNFGKAVISYIKTTAGTITADYDSFLPGTSANWIMAGTTYSSWAALQGAGYELHGTQP